MYIAHNFRWFDFVISLDTYTYINTLNALKAKRQQEYEII